MPILGSNASEGRIPPSVPRTITFSGGCQANGTNPQYNVSWLHPTTIAKWDQTSNPTITTDLKYTVTIRLTSDSSVVGTTTGNSITSSGGSTTTSGITLTPGTSYFVRVTASAYGFTSSADSSNVVATTSPANLGSISATAGNAQVTLTWSAVNNGGSTVTYNVQVFTSGGSLVNTSNTPNTTLTVTGLTNGTTYYAKVYAYNSCGATPTVQSANFTPVAPTPNFVTPNFPNFPNFATPNFPNFPNFATPNFPNFPNFATPNFPNFPNFATPAACCNYDMNQPTCFCEPLNCYCSGTTCNCSFI